MPIRMLNSIATAIAITTVTRNGRSGRSITTPNASISWPESRRTEV